MRATFPHPRDPSIILGGKRPLFGSWHLTVNGVTAEESDDGEYAVILGDGSRSMVTIDEQRFDPYPIFVIDGERYPLGGPLGVSGVIGALLPLGGVVMGPVGILIALIGVAATIRVSRAKADPILRLFTGFAFLSVSWGVGTWLWRTMGPGRELRPTTVDWSPLPPVAGIRAGAAARSALDRLADLPAVDTLPGGEGEIPPFTIAEVRQLRTWILAGRFSEAEETLRRLAQEARADVRRETRWRTAYRMTFQALPDSFSERLDDWVAISPEAAEPLAARAWNRYWIGYYWRGEGSGLLGPEALEGLSNAFAQGSVDAVAALAKDPDLMPAYWMLMNTARTEGDQETVIGLLAKALRRSPSSFESYYAGMIAFYPVWGGTLEQMQALAEAGMRGAGRNPDLARLGAYPTWKRGDMAVESSGGEGIPDARRALAMARDPLFYETLGHALWHAGRPAEGIAYLDTALQLDPTYDRALETRRKMFNAMMFGAPDARMEALGRSRDADMATLLALRPLMDP